MITLAVEDELTQLQRAFAEAIFFDHAPIPATIRRGSGRAHGSRFSVYRNNVIASLINAVAVRYPVVRKLLWEDAFNHIAHLYVTAEPPRSPVLLNYGDSFPQFLRRMGQTTSANYLADLAELEAARTRAYHSADATPISRDGFSALAPEQMPDLHVTLHPSVQLLRSRFPVVSIWEANVYANDNDNALSLWQPECTLIARPQLQVEVRRVTPGVYEFLSAFAERCTIGKAIERGMTNTPDFDLAEGFNALISADIVIDLEPSRCPTRQPQPSAKKQVLGACSADRRL
jgi:hypothetical protein